MLLTVLHFGAAAGNDMAKKINEDGKNFNNLRSAKPKPWQESICLC